MISVKYINKDILIIEKDPIYYYRRVFTIGTASVFDCFGFNFIKIIKTTTFIHTKDLY